MALGLLGPSTAAPANAVPDDASVRLQIVVKSLDVNDPDISTGGITGADTLHLLFSLARCQYPGCADPNGQRPVDRLADPTGDYYTFYTSGFDFPADPSDVTALNQAHPLNQGTPPLDRRYVSDVPEDGFALYADEEYQLEILLCKDLFIANVIEPGVCVGGNSYVGYRYIQLGGSDQESTWHLGLHTESLNAQTYDPYATASITYEITGAQIPDLHPTAIQRIADPTSPDDVVCLGVENIGQKNAGPFAMTLRIDDVIARDGSVLVGGLPGGQSGLECVHTDLPKDGVHTLTLTVDDDHAVPEQFEYNNIYREILDRTQPAAAPSSGPSGGNATSPQSGPSVPISSPARADLAVASIQVNGKPADQAGACKVGKNNVVVTVKNGGTVAASSFVTRLVVDDALDAPHDQSIDGLDPGKQQDVHFDRLSLDKGQHSLAVTVDPNDALPDKNSGNNTQRVTLSCTGG